MEEVVINLTDVVKYDDCIKNILLYWYKDYITLYDGTNEIMVKKSEIASIYNRYKSDNPVFNRYTSSRIIITCKNGLIIKVDISGSPQDSSLPKGYSKSETLNAPYGFLNSIKTYTNGTNNTINSYYDTNGNVYKIDGLNLITYFKRISFYDALKSVGVYFNASDRNDYNSSFLIDGRYVGSLTGSISNNNSIANITGCVFKYECDIGFDLNSTNIVSWIDQINNIKLGAYPNAVFSTDLYTSNSLRTITSNSGAKQLLANKILFSNYGYNKDTDSISICWIGGGQSIPAAYNVNDFIIIGDGINDIRIGIISNEFGAYNLYYADGPLILSSLQSNAFIGSYSNMYVMSDDIDNVRSSYINAVGFHCITIEKNTNNTGILKYYLNGLLKKTINSVPYKINNGFISVLCSAKDLMPPSATFGQEFRINHAGFYMFNKCLSNNDVTTLFNYTQNIFGHLPSNVLNPNFAGIYNLQADYGVTTDENNKVVLWEARCNRTIIYNLRGDITYSNLHIGPTGIKTVYMPDDSRLQNYESARVIIKSTNTSYSLYTPKGNQMDRTTFLVIKNTQLSRMNLIFDRTGIISAGNNTQIIAFTVASVPLPEDTARIELTTYTDDRNTSTTEIITDDHTVNVSYKRSNLIALYQQNGLNPDAEISALIIFDYVLNNTDLDIMFNYLRTKYITG